MNFDVSKNNLGQEGTKALAEALNGNQIMAELNLAENSMDKNGAMNIAKTIPTMGAMTTLNISNNSIPSDQQSAIKRICDSKSIALSL